MKNISATIMIPVYNVEEFIGTSLESAINQTYTGNYEILVVNDGSTDDTQEKVEWYKKKFDNLRLINQENKGAGGARNVLLDNSRGKYLLGLDADDALRPETLEKVIRYFTQNPNSNLVYSDHEEVDEQGKLMKTMNKAAVHELFKDIILHCHYPGHLRAFRKEGLVDSRFEPELRTAEDYDFLLKIIMKQWPNLQVGHIPQILYSYRINTQGLSQTVPKDMENKASKVLEKHLEENKVYGDKKFEVVPLTEEGLTFWDHRVEGESILTKKYLAKQTLIKFLTGGNK